jgi:hypothetical protein
MSRVREMCYFVMCCFVLLCDVSFCVTCVQQHDFNALMVFTYTQRRQTYFLCV